MAMWKLSLFMCDKQNITVTVRGGGGESLDVVQKKYNLPTYERGETTSSRRAYGEFLMQRRKKNLPIRYDE